DDECAGQITFRTATGDNTRMIITAGFGGSLFGGFSVPENHQAEVHTFRVEATRDTVNSVIALFQFLERPVGAPWRIRETIEYYTEARVGTVEYPNPRIVPGPADIRMHCEEMSANNVRVSASLNFVLVNTRSGYQQIGPELVGF
ncbi:hypothetical protein LCGC14_2053990, partial [marine sediment metagenome]